MPIRPTQVSSELRIYGPIVSIMSLWEPDTSRSTENAPGGPPPQLPDSRRWRGIDTLEHSGSLSVDLPEGPHTGQARLTVPAALNSPSMFLRTWRPESVSAPHPKEVRYFWNMRRATNEADWLILVPDGTNRPSPAGSFHLGGTAILWVTFVLYLVVLKATTSIPVRMIAPQLCARPPFFCSDKDLSWLQSCLKK
jgi:hypothetical protein